MCGFLSRKIDVLRSARQGDPIAAYLFIIALELLAIRIRHEAKVKGYCLGEYEQKLSVLADDVTFYTQGSKTEIERSIRTLFGVYCAVQ